ncbi:hypothetical protein AC578_1859 [Pseudocercospora eumusae]|uniref:IBR domain-containing protein n=1 Tax=Pseudocercospora eumusae TaxID=321146 RepID=A0A139GUP9_9PEZI|nr:hypothetical protein AC578_1859 [Pseudocercospora eumusae]
MSDKPFNNEGGPSQPDPPPQAIVCAACFDDCTDKNVQVANDHLCEECFKIGYVPQFFEALKDESKFPVKYGTFVLKPRHYRKFFDHEFRVAWREKRAEYNTPVKHRLYCNNLTPSDEAPVPGDKRCGKFLGSKANIIPDGLHTSVLCKSCNLPTCTRCSQPDLDKHVCQSEEVDDEDAFRGLTRGVDFQVCPVPSCQVKIALQDGCNGVECGICKTPFCFICGKKTDQPGHWNTGSSCPRFGKKGSKRAIFDNPADPPPQPVFRPTFVPPAPRNAGTMELQATIQIATARLRALEAERSALATQTALDERHAEMQLVDWIRAQPHLAQTPEFRRFEADQNTLMTLHARVVGIRDGGQVHELIHALQTGINVYWALLPGVAGAVNRDSGWKRAEHARIFRLAAEIPGLRFGEWSLLQQIVDSYELAWNGRMEELRRIVR